VFIALQICLGTPQLTILFTKYEISPDEILGDPAQAQSTKDIIALGWQPPNPQSRWDVLPLVAMAEGDEPAFATLPPELTQLIPIGHPMYPKMAGLDLKWVKFPALSRLGFDIGGVQYTASPFIGWFMDAEIGFRNLADTFRYNALPDVAKAIGWSSRTHTFEELSDHDRLLWLSRAQAELNYAVYCSFQKAGVTCTSSLTASQSWTAFDDQHLREKGYRLNADPYWISPPQGSLVPLWHRGGAPNYQPKPMVARHKCDPVNVWKRRNNALPPATEQVDGESSSKVVGNGCAPHLPKVHIFYCGTSGTAANMAQNTRKSMAKNPSRTVGEFGTLNSFDPKKIHLEDTFMLIVATTGKGEIPSNGQKFIQKLESVGVSVPMRYSIFGIGDSVYYETFNWASKSVQRILDERQLRPLMLDHVIESDVAVENPPWTDFRTWLCRANKALDGVVDDSTEDTKEKEPSTQFERQYNVLETYREGTIHFDPLHHQPGRISKMSLKISELEYDPMDHIRILPRNSEEVVRRVMLLLGAKDDQTISIISAKSVLDSGKAPDEKQSHLLAVPVRRFLLDFVDLHAPFVFLDWAQSLPEVNNQSALHVLKDLSKSREKLISSNLLEKLLFSMAPLRPRSYSIASSSANVSGSITDRTNLTLDLLLRVIPNGRFSRRCPADIGNGGKTLYKLSPNKLCSSLLRPNGKPLIVVGCGAGIAPIRSLTQHLINTDTDSALSLFLGFKPDHIMNEVLYEMVQQASKKGILDILHVVPSNREHLRVQDHFADDAEALRRKMGEEKGWFYVCGSEAVVRGVKEKLEGILGHEMWTMAQERILCETF
jgi:nitric oxide synthase oxygenase domain/subunit/sulfite reductase alpha subunit-like flavoprotein